MLVFFSFGSGGGPHGWALGPLLFLVPLLLQAGPFIINNLVDVVSVSLTVNLQNRYFLNCPARFLTGRHVPLPIHMSVVRRVQPFSRQAEGLSAPAWTLLALFNVAVCAVGAFSMFKIARWVSPAVWLVSVGGGKGGACHGPCAWG